MCGRSVAPAISLLLLLVSVAFFTLLERKVLAYLILRRGPNKPSALGLLVPFADALNLLANPFTLPHLGSSFLIVLACFIMFSVPAFLWLFVSNNSPFWDWSFSMLSVLVWSSLSVWALIAAGWGSNSKYSTLGGTRCLAQTISYEVCLTLLFFGFCLLSSFDIFVVRVHWGLFLYLHLILILFLVLLAETNRSPFDFAEGESELVSGYNVEYSGPGFVLLFLAEYLSILFMSFLTGALTCGCSPLTSCIFGSCYGFVFVWVRGTLPRLRYDQLMSLSWKSLLPLILSSLLILLVIYYHIFCALNASFNTIMHHLIIFLCLLSSKLGFSYSVTFLTLRRCSFTEWPLFLIWVWFRTFSS